MRQLTKEEALKIAKSGVWKNWSDWQLFNLQIRQDRLFCDFRILLHYLDFYKTVAFWGFTIRNLHNHQKGDFFYQLKI